MPERIETESRKLLGRLRKALATSSEGQDRLDKVVNVIASSMRTEVCSIYLFRDEDTLELCATEGLQAEAVHQTRMKLGEGLVGRTARTKRARPYHRKLTYLQRRGQRPEPRQHKAPFWCILPPSAPIRAPSFGVWITARCRCATIKPTFFTV